MRSATAESCGELRAQLIAESIPIPGRGGVLMLRTPVTNQTCAALFAESGLHDGAGGGYVMMNAFNPDLPLVPPSAPGTPPRLRAGFGEHPVVGVSWIGAMVLADYLGGRLPSIDEWEAAAGAPRHVYPWGSDEPTLARANFDEHIGQTTPVTRYPQNPNGFFDLAGNAGEWCVEERGTGADPSDITSALKAYRRTEQPVKGGGWNKSPSYLASTATRYKWARIGTVGIGFRVVFDRE